MGYLINAWNETQRKFLLNLKQIVNIAGDEYLELNDAIQEFRDFLTLIDIPTLNRLFQECYSKDKKLKFDARGFAFQDIVNEMGRRLGYQVEHGLYRGKRNEIGFDGLWQSKDGAFIVMESKATGDYAFSPETVIKYRDELIRERNIQRNKCSILVVYGRDDKSTLKNAVKGSDGAAVIRLISANALFQLVKIATEASTDTKLKQITTLLRPSDYFVLDNLVELVFPETDDDIETVEDEEVFAQEGKTDTPDDQNSENKDDTSEETIQTKGSIAYIVDTVPEEIELFHLSYMSFKATGYLDEGCFVVLKGSQISPVETPSCHEGIRQLRAALTDAAAVVDWVFAKNIKFSSTSMAAGCIMGAAVSGTRAWKNEHGVTIKELRNYQEKAEGMKK